MGRALKWCLGSLRNYSIECRAEVYKELTHIAPLVFKVNRALLIAVLIASSCSGVDQKH